MARDRLITPTPQQIECAERELERVRDSLPADLWARLVRCKARAMASVAIAQRRLGLRPTGYRSDLRAQLTKAQRPFDARRAAANDLDDDDDVDA